MSRLFLGLPAPAKLNLFLHVIGRRADGYHELQSLMVPISLADTLDFELRDDGAIHRSGDIIGEPLHDLCVRAARLLQAESGTRYGVDIAVDKRIPAGSGLGGGSSDAATTLLALNRLWRLDWPRPRLAALALRLGADVPFFLGRGAALAEGVGERLTEVDWPPCCYALIHPQVAVSTAEIFSAIDLTATANGLRIAAFSALRDNAAASGSAALIGTNDLQPVAAGRYPVIAQALEHLGRFGAARMTGSGAAVFAPMPSQAAAQQAVADLPPGWQGWAVASLPELPLAAW
jgi:4-diphosphocytidyl-2-C-methyl-D-erythritol kinase